MAPRVTHSDDTSTSPDVTSADSQIVAPVEDAPTVDQCVWPPVLVVGASGADVSALHAQLGVRGWFHGDATSWVYDISTEQAVQQMQRDLTVAGAYTGPIHGQFDADTRNGACVTYPM